MNVSKGIWGGGLLLVTSLAAAQASLADGCTWEYSMVNQWSNGFQGEVFITPGAALTSWTLTWTFPSGQTLTGLWNGIATQAGANVTVDNASYNGAVIPREFAIAVAFVASITGTNTSPSDFALNGVPCTNPNFPPPPSPIGIGLNASARNGEYTVPASRR